MKVLSTPKLCWNLQTSLASNNVKITKTVNIWDTNKVEYKAVCLHKKVILNDNSQKGFTVYNWWNKKNFIICN